MALVVLEGYRHQDPALARARLAALNIPDLGKDATPEQAIKEVENNTPLGQNITNIINNTRADALVLALRHPRAEHPRHSNEGDDATQATA